MCLLERDSDHQCLDTRKRAQTPRGKTPRQSHNRATPAWLLASMQRAVPSTNAKPEGGGGGVCAPPPPLDPHQRSSKIGSNQNTNNTVRLRVVSLPTVHSFVLIMHLLQSPTVRRRRRWSPIVVIAATATRLFLLLILPLLLLLTTTTRAACPPDGCGPYGRCVRGTLCICNLGYDGEDCSIPIDICPGPVVPDALLLNGVDADEKEAFSCLNGGQVRIIHSRRCTLDFSSDVIVIG
jgi:hypothetical protein